MISLKIEVPIACFRQSQAREHLETYPVSPPSTIYGMLLSLVGEVDRYQHCGVRLAIALLSKPKKSIVVRTFHRYKKRDIHDPSNIKLDYQELLTDIRLIVAIDSGKDRNQPSLENRLRQSFEEPASVCRFGGLSLGESRDLVNSVSLLKGSFRETTQWLVQDECGSLTLPYWVDHIGSQGTRWLRYKFQKTNQQPPEAAWTEIKSA